MPILRKAKVSVLGEYATNIGGVYGGWRAICPFCDTICEIAWYSYRKCAETTCHHQVPFPDLISPPKNSGWGGGIESQKKTLYFVFETPSYLRGLRKERIGVSGIGIDREEIDNG